MAAGVWTWGGRLAGWLLAVLVVLPMYRLLDASAGIAARQFVILGTGFGRASLVASLAALVLGAVAMPVADRVWSFSSRALAWLTPRRLPVVAGVVAFASSVAFSYLALDRGPYLIDGMSQLFQARLFASGLFGLPMDVPGEFWHYQYLAPSSVGWTSQYPPGFAALLAVGMRWGGAWLVGPFVHGVTAFVGVRFAQRLFPDDARVVMAGAVLLAWSPFTLALSGSFMNHGLAAVLALCALAAALPDGRPDRPGLGRGLLTGLALGLLAAVRPLTALMSGLVVAGVWWTHDRWAAPSTSGASVAAGSPTSSASGAGRSSAAQLRFAMGALAGILPGTVALLLYNRSLFGSVFTFGYTVAQGPNHGLGFHVDPWGVAYGPLAALGYMATELRALGAELAGVPLPLTLLVGVALAWSLTERRILLLLAWGLAPVVAGFFYWHHDLSMGPRLLADAAPAWMLLVAWAGVRVVDRVEQRVGQRVGQRAGRSGRFARSVALVAVAGACVATPVRLAQYGTSARSTDLIVEDAEAAPLVFVHDSWESRIGARLSSRGLRDDQVRAVLSAYSTCQLQTVLDSLSPGSPVPHEIISAPSGPPALVVRAMPSGSVIRTLEGEEMLPECLRQGGADFAGVVGLPQRSWRGDLPGAESGRPMYVRDFGPTANEEVLRMFEAREPKVLLLDERATSPRLVTYVEGMRLLWNAGGGPP